MPNKAHGVRRVVVSVHVASSNPVLPVIEVEDIIHEGVGTLTETIFGGEVSIRLVLTSGKLKPGRELEIGEFVYARGERGNGTPFVVNGPLTTDSASEPWEFSRA
jgi:hypothetical protein